MSSTGQQSWEEQASRKRESLKNSIPQEWLLPEPIPTAEQERDVTGPYIWQYLSAHEREITETDAVGIVTKTSSGQWTAKEVLQSFAHRAAIAHQLVCYTGLVALK